MDCVNLISSTAKNYVLIPYWIETAVIRNNYDINDVLNYNKLRTIINQEDSGEFLALQNIQSFTTDLGIDNTGHLFNCWRNTTNESQIPELDSALVPLSCNKDVQSEVINRLSVEYAPIVSKRTHLYRCKEVSRDVTLVILEPGFTEYICQPHAQFNFVQTLLKSLYVYTNVTDASFSNLFSKYVRKLEQSLNV